LISDLEATNESEREKRKKEGKERAKE